METKLQQSILDTLAYFDLFHHPLTAEEIRRNLWQYAASVDLVQLKAILAEMVATLQIGFADSFYFILGKDENVVTRQQRVSWGEDKLKIALRGIKKLRYIPFVRAVFICNTLSMGTADKASDIDLFIVAKAKRVWLVRFFANVILKVCGLRTGKHGYQDKICLSFFVDDSRLNLADLKIDSDDIYLAYWLITLWPIYDPDNFFRELRQKNLWVQSQLRNALVDFCPLPNYRVQDNFLSRLIKKVWEKMWQGAYGSLLETQAFEMQKAKLKWRGLLDSEKAGGIIVGRDIIKLHENDRRMEYQSRWQASRVISKTVGL